MAVFIDNLSYGMIFTLFPYYVEQFKGSPLTVGLIISSFYFLQFLFAPIWGRISDKVGRKKIYLIGLFGTSLALLGSGVAKILIMLFITRLFAGLFSAATSTVSYAFVADITKEKERTAKFGLLGAAWGLGFVIGPTLGGLISNYSISAVFIVSGIIELLNLIFSASLLPDLPLPKKSINQIRKNPFNLKAILNHFKFHGSVLMIVLFLAAFANANLEAVFPLFAQVKFNLNETNIGFFFTFIGITVAITQGLVVGKAVTLFGEIKTIVIATIFMITGYVLVAISGDIIFLLISSGILAFGIALNDPTITSLISKQSREETGTILGLVWSIDSLANILGPAFGGFTYEKISASSPFFFNSTLLVFSVFVLINIFLSKKPMKFNALLNLQKTGDSLK